MGTDTKTPAKSKEKLPEGEKLAAKQEGLVDGEFHFTLKLETIFVNLEGTDGAMHRWQLQELTGENRDKYMNIIAGKVKYNAKTGKQAGLSSVDGLQSGLLKDAMWHTKEERKPTDEEMAKWPNRVLEALGEWVVEKSGLGDGEDEKGNDDEES